MTQEKYLDAEYHVFTEPPFILKVGQFSKELSALHRSTGSDTSFFITAFNPLGVIQSAADNKKFMRSLLDCLVDKTYSEESRQRLIFGSGNSSDGSWPDEVSVLVLYNDGPNWPIELCRQFKQNAFIFCAEDAIPQCIMVI